MKKRSLFSIVLAVAILLSFSACSGDKDGGEVVISGEGEQSTVYEKEESTAFVFTAEDLYGKKVSSDMFKKSKITMVNIWATFCGPCKNEMPYLGELSKEYDEKDVQIAGIIIDLKDSNGNVLESQIEAAKDIVESSNASYTHIIPSDSVEAYISSVSVVPTTIFFDSDGNVIGSNIIGSKSKEDWKSVIDEKLQEVSK